MTYLLRKLCHRAPRNRRYTVYFIFKLYWGYTAILYPIKICTTCTCKGVTILWNSKDTFCQLVRSLSSVSISSLFFDVCSVMHCRYSYALITALFRSVHTNRMEFILVCVDLIVYFPLRFKSNDLGLFYIACLIGKMCRFWLNTNGL